MSTNKITVMNKTSNHREILLFKGTSFASRQFGKMVHSRLAPGEEFFSEQLEASGQDGFLNELFQASCKEPVTNSRLFIWQVDQSSSFLHLSMGDSPLCTDKAASVDPYFFWTTLNMN